MAYSFGKESLKELSTVVPAMQKVTTLALSYSKIDWRIVQGLRSFADQLKYYKQGKSRVDPRKGLPGRHQTGHAVDVAAWVDTDGDGDKEISWQTNTGLYSLINAAFQKASKELGIPITWGGTFKTLKDYGHFEIPRSWKG